MITPLTCEINVPSKSKGQDLHHIVSSCAAEIAQPLIIRSRLIPRNQRGSKPTHITLHLPAALASSQHEVWCLTCRIACFCPEVRVSVLVLGADMFRGTEAPKADAELNALWA